MLTCTGKDREREREWGGDERIIGNRHLGSQKPIRREHVTSTSMRGWGGGEERERERRRWGGGEKERESNWLSASGQLQSKSQAYQVATRYINQPT